MTCRSTLTLPWQPSFGSHVLKNCIFFLKLDFNYIFINGIITLHSIEHYSIKVIVTVDEIQAF